MTDDVSVWDDDTVGDDVPEDDIIELTDIVSDETGDPETEEVIELTDIIEPESDEGDPADIEPAAAAEDTEIEGPLEMEADLVFDAPDLQDDPPEPETEGGGEPGEPTEMDTDMPAVAGVSPEQVEAALERVIEKKFSDKIESILFEVMENVIEKELKSIKESLQKDLDQIGN